MPFRDFRKIFKGKIVSVRDNNQSYSFEQELEIADREVEKITNKVTEYTVYDGCLIITVKPM